jgi:hypothetical protein
VHGVQFGVDDSRGKRHRRDARDLSSNDYVGVARRP